MLNKNFSFKTLVMTLALGFLSVWSLSAQTDNRLNGNWFSVNEGIEKELTLNNGNYQMSLNGIPHDRGTYTTNNEEIITKPTHFFGGAFNDTIGFPVIESKWYTVNDFAIVIRPVFLELGLSEADINYLTNFMILQPPYLYSVDANTLTLSYTLEGDIIVRTYTRR